MMGIIITLLDENFHWLPYKPKNCCQRNIIHLKPMNLAVSRVEINGVLLGVEGDPHDKGKIDDMRPLPLVMKHKKHPLSPPFFAGGNDERQQCYDNDGSNKFAGDCSCRS
jgi:hypothetical protein